MLGSFLAEAAVYDVNNGQPGAPDYLLLTQSGRNA